MKKQKKKDHVCKNKESTERRQKFASECKSNEGRPAKERKNEIEMID